MGTERCEHMNKTATQLHSGKEPGEQVGEIRKWEGHFKGYYETQSEVV